MSLNFRGQTKTLSFKDQIQGLFQDIFTLNVLSPSAHLQAEHEVAADALLSDNVLHGAKCGAQVGVEKLSGQQTHRGGHQVVWQGHVCDLKMEKQLTNLKKRKNYTIVLH